MNRRTVISMLVICALLLCGCKDQKAAGATTTTAAETTTAAPAAAATTTTTAAAEAEASETTAADEELVGADWRTWGIIDGYGTINVEGKEIDVCACVYSDRVELYYDEASQRLYKTVEYPSKLTSEQYEHSSIEFSDVSGDGIPDITVKAGTDEALERSMTWVYDSGEFVYIEALAYPATDYSSVNSAAKEHIPTVLELAGTWIDDSNTDDTLWILPETDPYRGLFIHTAADGTVERGTLEFEVSANENGELMNIYEFKTIDGKPWNVLVLSGEIGNELKGDRNYQRMLAGNAGEAPSEQTAAEKMNALSVIMGCMAGGSTVLLDVNDDPVLDENGNYLSVKVNDPRFANTAGFEEYISLTCTGELKDSLIELSKERCTDRNGSLYIDVTHASGFPIFPLSEGVVISDLTDDSFTATTVGADAMNGQGRAKFVRNGNVWFIESYEFGSFAE